MRSRSPYRPTPSSISYSFEPGPMTPVIKALIIANVVVFVGTWILGADVSRSSFSVI